MICENPESAKDLYFDQKSLATYLRDRVPGFDQPFKVTKFLAGQSNPTFRIETASGNYVLRKKPAGTLLPKAHMIEREFAILKGLRDVIPVPRVLDLCEDESVIGQAFFLMDHVDGRILADPGMKDADREERKPLTLELAATLARLHLANITEHGLDALGRSGGYIPRQLARWSKQYAASRIEDNPDMDRLVVWLGENLPDNDEVAFIHGDFRSYNVIFDRSSSKVAAVLDWELATIGHPLADLAYFCLPYYLPSDDHRGFHGADPAALGVPSESELRSAYCREVGREELPHWDFYIVFSLFRSAAIRAGVFKRAHDGSAANAQALEMGSRYRGVAAKAWSLASRL